MVLTGAYFQAPPESHDLPAVEEVNDKAAPWSKCRCVSSNGACANYVMVSRFQWKPFWFATQRDPQNDWTATQNRVKYDVFAQAPFNSFVNSSRGGPLTPIAEYCRFREHLISSQFFSKRNAFQIGFTPLPPPSIRKAYRTFSDNNRCRLSSRPRLSTTKLLPAGLLSFSSREASADNIISTSSSFSHKFPVSLHASSALRLASFEADRDCRQRKHLQTSHNGWMENGMDPLF